MKIFFTIAGTRHYFGTGLFEKGMKVRLEKEPDNDYDTEAIQVKVKGVGKVGYVANSPYTVLGDCWSAGRLYDKIGAKAKAKVLHVTDRGVVCVLNTDKNPPPDEGGREPVYKMDEPLGGLPEAEGE